MPFIQNILKYNSISIVGTAKNTGKTTCLNYVIKRLKEENVNFAVTSIGVDGEERDVLYQTPKPRITLCKNMIFITSEEDYANKEFPADILDVSKRTTPLGKLITARANGNGNVVLSGPSDSKWLSEVISGMEKYGVRLTLVDGALSRMSLASPAITDAMILCTGAACSAQLRELIQKTKFRCQLIELEKVENKIQEQLMPLENDLWQLNNKTNQWEKICNSVFTLEKESKNKLENLKTVYVSGAVTNNFIKILSTKKSQNTQLIIRDFTKLFVEPATFQKFVRRGGSIKVLQKPKLLAVCTNPVSPEGIRLNPTVLKEEMQVVLQVPVYDIKMVDSFLFTSEYTCPNK